MAEEGVLQAIQRFVLGEALDGDDAAAGGARDGDQAGADLAIVEQDRAGAAVAGVAADFGAGEAELVAQDVGEAVHRVGVDLHWAGVQGERDALRDMEARRLE